MHTTQLRSPQDFGEFLGACGVRFTYDPELRLFSLHSRPDLPEPDVRVEWLQATGVVRVFSWVLLDIPQDSLADTALCMAQINASLLLPGFILDVAHRWVAWRGVAVLDGSGAISSDVPASLIHMAARASDRYHRALAMAATPRAEAVQGELPAWAVDS